MNRLLTAFMRTKHLKPSDFQTTPLQRCLSTKDLTALAISSTIGSSIYVLTGEVIRLKAGPSIILSYLVAGLATLLCALCYAEFGARFPKAGSAYIYTYVTIGELCAFTIGWNLVLENVVASAAVASVWASFINSLLNDRIQDFVENAIETINIPFFAKYPDILAFLVVVISVTVVAIGVKQSVAYTWFFLILNVALILFIIIAGFCFADFSNWSNFFPFGVQGTMAGAAILFYNFAGFDVVASCAEEAKTPSKSIPIAIVGCLAFCFLAFVGVSAALSLMLPYNKLEEYSSIANAFDQRGFPAGKYFVAVGATFALLSCLVSSFFPLPRILYSMATDGVVFAFLGRINERTGTPVIACIVGGTLAALLALLLDLISLVEMLSIGTLLAYTIVTLCVLLLRYRPGDAGIQVDRSESPEEAEPDDDIEMTVQQNTSKTSGVSDDNRFPEKTNNGRKENVDKSDNISNQNDTSTLHPWTRFYHRVIGWQQVEPTQETYSTVKIASFVFVVLSIIVESCLIYGMNSFTLHPGLWVIGVFLVLAILFVVQIIASQPQSKSELSFKVRFVPLVPLLSVFMNIYLMMMLSYYTWIRFGVWMVIGMAIYLFYGVKHSKQNTDLAEHSQDKGNYTKLNESDNEEITQ